MKKTGIVLLFLTFSVPTHSSPQTQNNYWYVKVPVANVRSDKSDPSSKYEYDEKQETQILYGEPVLVHQIKGDWAYIECTLQQEYTHHSKWEGYPGWTLLKNLTQTVIPEADCIMVPGGDIRKVILDEARRHLGFPYLWGGRSLHDPQNKDVLTGVDCSGLVNLSFYKWGILVPRDAHEQYMKSHPLEVDAVKPGDLFFLAKKERPDKIIHVGFISGRDSLLEAPQSGESVREISFQGRFGKKLNDLKNGDTVGDRIIYFGTLLTGEL